MPNFLVEVYTPRSARLTDVEAAARSAARGGGAVRYLESILVPEDETCFLLVEAETADAVREAATRAAVPFERVLATADRTDDHLPDPA